MFSVDSFTLFIQLTKRIEHFCSKRKSIRPQKSKNKTVSAERKVIFIDHFLSIVKDLPIPYYIG
jgi:hypothetical protein